MQAITPQMSKDTPALNSKVERGAQRRPSSAGVFCALYPGSRRSELNGEGVTTPVAGLGPVEPRGCASVLEAGRGPEIDIVTLCIDRLP
jgi:hypothetical protein